MPAWSVAVLAAGATGFLGAWFGAWLQTRHDRRERLVDRRINAADEATQAFADALLKVASARAQVELVLISTEAADNEAAKQAFDKANTSVSEAMATTL